MKYLTDKEIESIVEAIQSAEEYSTGEIRVHIDSTPTTNHSEKAMNLFNEMCRDKTKDKNAVLFNVHFEQKYLIIIGDEGIHQVVHQEFWDILHDEITGEFAKRNYCSALKNAILKTGLELKKYFPITDENPNELPNEVTFS